MLTYDRVGPAKASHYCLVLHGLGDSMEGWRGIVPELGLKDITFFLVNAPDDYFGGFSWFPYPGINGPIEDRSGLSPAIARSRDLLLETIQHLMQECDFTQDQLFLMGFSQGCVMAMDTALRSDQRYAGILGISGALPLMDEYPAAFGKAVHQQNYFMTHGNYDDVIPLHTTQAQVEALKALDVKLDWNCYDKAHGLDPYKELGDIRAWFLGLTLSPNSNE